MGLLCLLSLVRGGCGLVFFVIVIASACKIFRSFVFVGRSKLQARRGQHIAHMA